MIKYLKIKNLKIGDIIIYSALIIISIVMLYPVLYMASLSLSDTSAVINGKVKLFPVGWSLDAYKYVLREQRIATSYINTVIYALIGTLFSLLFTSMLAYPLSIQGFLLRKYIIIMLVITLFFSGGLIPYFITIRNLNMINTLWVMVIPGSVSAWYVIIYRTFFQSIPSSMHEAAFIDGANDITILFRIIIPLSKPLLAAMALFSLVRIWNDYFTAMIFLTNNKKYPLQMILRSMVTQAEMNNKDSMNMMGQFDVTPRTIRSATIIVAMLPIMCIYPFMQKYFAHGVMLGSIKG